jgi:gliding motility-associated-like protein
VIYPIKVTDYMTLYFPNAFSPNGDGLNDVFKASGTFVESFEMYIYDRWGQLVLKTNDINKGWDGIYRTGDAPQDTYVYKGKAADVFGHKVNFQGQINLVR